MEGVEERAACAQLKRRFEAAGFRIKENQTFDEDGVWFEIDGFDAERRVGYEYLTEEAGDSWDVDGRVIAELAERRKRGELHVLVVDEADAPDAATLDRAIDEFLRSLPAGADAPAPAPAEGAVSTGEAPAATAAAEPTAAGAAPTAGGAAPTAAAPGARPPKPAAKKSEKKRPARKSR